MDRFGKGDAEPTVDQMLWTRREGMCTGNTH